ncbi:MAG: Pr6Pr family membrane protein, partial [Pseudomonadota bacterium]|nr:Pr6Pr family membrane protein [Pseudomonadota bacterium]
VFPATYLVYTLLRGMTTGWYPYPFLNPATAGGYTGVAMYSLGIFVAFLVVGFALLAVGNRSSTEDVRPSEADS